MHHFTIHDIVNLSGIKAHTLRVWEQRYQILRPKRKESNHRYYDNDDLKEILRIAWLNKNGYKISRIAQMSRRHIIELCSNKPDLLGIKDAILNDFILAANNLDEELFHRAMQSSLIHLGFEKTIFEIFYPLLESIGRNWMSDKTRPVQEHFASEQIKRKILAGIQLFPMPDEGPLTVLFTPVDEMHEIPLLVIHYFLRKKGIRIAYLGTNTSMDDLEFYIQKREASILQFHLITHFGYQSPDELIEELLSRFPFQQIVMSGPVSDQVTISSTRLTCLRSKQQLLDFCQ